MRHCLVVTLCATALLALSCVADDYVPRNTQRAGEEPPSPVEALYQLSLPPGFEATLFAHEPAVRQPIAMTLDSRGRLWVVESYSYEEWEERGEDRIVILEDIDQDGRHDKRTVFYDRGKHFAGIALGLGGVWVADAPNILFIPDKDRNDVPDGPPEVVLTGWTTEAEHNMVNGLCWGPDGWLYGRHGVLAWSNVGRPETPIDQREEVNCGIWRYHPGTKVFEHVVRGSTNPWGLDWDAEGELFMSGNVNGHLWHVIPGAYLERMHPTTRTPYVYERLTMFAEAPHYAATSHWKRDWNRGQIGRDGESALGGGHSHCGAMIYLGDQWPEDYRGKLFMCNTHGRRVNIDVLERKGSSFRGRYEGDFLLANQSWFRGVSLLYGPDGSVYVSDWTDDGECHDADGVHRTSGRIFQIRYGKPRSWKGDLQALRDEDLLGLLDHRNRWFPRQARRVLQQRAMSDRLEDGTPARIRERCSSDDANRRLQAIWAAHVTQCLDESMLLALTHDPSEAIRAWAVRLLADHTEPSAIAKARLEAMALKDDSARVRLYLASVAQRVGAPTTLLLGLASRGDDHEDPVLQRMLWYALEPALADAPNLIAPLARSASPFLVRLAARRLMEADLIELGGREALGAALAAGSATEALLEGTLTTLRKLDNPELPAGWEAMLAPLRDHEDTTIQGMAAELAVRFRHGPTLDAFLSMVASQATPMQERLSKWEALLAVPNAEVDAMAASVLREGPEVLRRALLPHLPQRAIPDWSEWVVSHWETLSGDEQAVAANVLCAHVDTCRLLLEAIGAQRVPRAALSATHAQQIGAMKDDDLNALLEEHWGSVRHSSVENEAAIQRYRDLIRTATREADHQRGRVLFQQNCAACHQLFGEGGTLGPDLTGSDRGNLDYLLQNIIDPSASVAADYRLTIATGKGGRVLSGALLERDRASLTIRTLIGEERMARSQLANMRTLKTSLMPEGILQSLADNDVLDLIAYLRHRAAAP